VIFVFVALVAPLAYGLEGNFIAWRTTQGLSAIEIILGSSVIGLAIAVPLAIGTGQWVTPFRTWGVVEFAIIGLSILHAFSYVGYVWLVPRAGSVFAAQVAYLVTAAGVLWSLILLSEHYSLWVWLAFGLMMLAIFLVQPKEASSEDKTRAV
jgi:drug/metabolite transporter (DMT)-like permease